MSFLQGAITLIALLTFIGIVVWAYSRGRAKANQEASMLPFAQPDEVDQQARNAAGHDGNPEQQGGKHE